MTSNLTVYPTGTIDGRPTLNTLRWPNYDAHRSMSQSAEREILLHRRLFDQQPAVAPLIAPELSLALNTISRGQPRLMRKVLALLQTAQMRNW